MPIPSRSDSMLAQTPGRHFPRFLIVLSLSVFAGAMYTAGAAAQSDHGRRVRQASQQQKSTEADKGAAESRPTASSGQSNTSEPALDLVRKVVQNELRISKTDTSLWRYLEDKKQDGSKEELRDVVQTSRGSIYRILALNGQPLSVAQKAADEKRVAAYLHDASAQAKKRKEREADIEHTRRIFEMLPQAFLFEYDGDQQGCTVVKFRPNPKFSPPDREAEVLHTMAGRLWLEAKQLRLARIDGTMLGEVKFGWGLLGHLDKGGHFSVRQSEVAPGYWEITDMTINMHGKIIFLKTLNVQEKDLSWDYRRMPDSESLNEAFNLLKTQPTNAREGEVQGAGDPEPHSANGATRP